MNEFNTSKTIYLFADRDTGEVHQYKITDEPRHDAFLTEEEREDWHAFDDRQEGLPNHLQCLTHRSFSMEFIVMPVEVLFNEIGDKFMMNGIVFDVYGDNEFTLSEVQYKPCPK